MRVYVNNRYMRILTHSTNPSPTLTMSTQSSEAGIGRTPGDRSLTYNRQTRDEMLTYKSYISKIRDASLSSSASKIYLPIKLVSRNNAVKHMVYNDIINEGSIKSKLDVVLYHQEDAYFKGCLDSVRKSIKLGEEKSSLVSLREQTGDRTGENELLSHKGVEADRKVWLHLNNDIQIVSQIESGTCRVLGMNTDEGFTYYLKKVIHYYLKFVHDCRSYEDFHKYVLMEERLDPRTPSQYIDEWHVIQQILKNTPSDQIKIPQSVHL